MNSQKKKNIIIGVILSLIAIVGVVLLLVRGCEKKEYLVKFMSEGKVVQTNKVKENETVAKPIDPTRKGYSFLGWYLGNKEFDFKTKITKNITLKAKWEKAEIKLQSTEIELNVGEEKIIEILELPKGITKDDIIYELSENGIITVDKDGKIKALKAGKVNVTVKSKDGKYKEIVTVTIKEEEKNSEESSNQTNTTSKKTTTKKSSGGTANNGGSSAPATSNPTPSQPQPVEDKYTITITKLQKQDGSIDQYEIGAATKNGASFTDFTLVGIGGSYYPKSGTLIDSSVGTPGSATLVKNGSVVGTATINWQTRTVQ